MLYLMMVDGSPRQIPQAESAQIEGGQVICRSGDGLIVAIFDAPLVSTFGNDEALAEASRFRVARRALRAQAFAAGSPHTLDAAGTSPSP